MRFKVQLSAITVLSDCVGCGLVITPDDNQEVIFWSAFDEPWRFHEDCFVDVLSGVIEFYRIFLEEKKVQKLFN